jgi:hypothetical protein
MTRIQFPAEEGIFLFTITYKLAMGPAHPASYPTVPGALSPGIKWLAYEANHLSPSSATVKNVWS